uniref:30S ribosomal protein S14, chloroplastic n=1 Tax=Epipogium aphyllum TaxID=449980 RepID=A0A0B4PKD1_9ASPA|nr:ribosomal protein S14 [Epipogium aphyllum]
MKKKRCIQKENKKYNLIRQSLKKELCKVKSINEKSQIYIKLQKLPRNSSTTRIYRCCFLTGRTRSNFRFFGLSGYIIREMFNKCLLPGTTTSSW